MVKVALIASDHVVPDWVGRTLAKAGVDYHYHECYTREDLKEHASNADILWFMSSREGLVTEENMDIFKNVSAVFKIGSGTDNIDHDACTKRGIIVAHSPDVVTEPTSDHAIAMLFSAVRQTARQDHLVRQGVWDPYAAPPLALFTGADLGIIGFGRIGQAIIRKLSGFQMKVRVYDPYVDTIDIEALGARRASLEELLKQSQFIILACPLTEETKGLIDIDQFKLMRRDAILINCARAGIVDESTLVKALKEGWISAAAFDVLSNYPLKDGDELLTLDNIVFTPHSAGNAPDHMERIFKSSIDVIIRISKRYMPTWIANNGVVPKINFQ